MTQLIKHYDEVLSTVEEGNNCDVIYLDFAKAFYKCDHQLRNHRLLEAIISGKVGKWINSFITNRKQKVKVGKTKSDDKEVSKNNLALTSPAPLRLLFSSLVLSKQSRGDLKNRETSEKIHQENPKNRGKE